MVLNVPMAPFVAQLTGLVLKSGLCEHLNMLIRRPGSSFLKKCEHINILIRKIWLRSKQRSAMLGLVEYDDDATEIHGWFGV